MRNLSSKVAKDLLIEVILPLSLFDWNINKLTIKIGPQQRPLCTRYPLAIRSLERLYHSDYDFLRQQWVDKWNACTSCQSIDATKFYWLYSENYYCETLLDELEDSAWFF